MTDRDAVIGVNNNVKSDESVGCSGVKQPSWRCCSMQQIHRNVDGYELEHAAAVRPTEQHSVLFQYPLRSASRLPPPSFVSGHKWDAIHVRLPCSCKSQYPVTSLDGGASIESRWEMIQLSLLRPIKNSYELQEAILSYNTKYANSWNFWALHQLFEKELDEDESQVFFDDLLPRIIRLALRLPELVRSPIPLLKQGQTRAISLTQQQISCLLANAFLCTFPRRNTMKQKSEYSAFPDINFNRLFQSTGASVLEKIKCICHYFRRVCPTENSSANVPTGVVTFQRRSLTPKDLPNWTKCDTSIGSIPLHVTSEGTIEDQGLALLQVDFANKFLGGGVLGSGCVQEEIRFVICPELLISKLFTEVLRPTEAVLMIGAERYSNYKGYASTFQWAGNHEDITPRDSSRRRKTYIVAIDALFFQQPALQYNEELMLRELNKAYVGFYHTLSTPAPGVASGNWGCGAFGGEAKLKALLQIMVCAAVQRPLVYYTFGDADLRDKIYDIYNFFVENNIRVNELWQTLRKFKSQNLSADELYNFISSCLGSKEEGTILSKIKLKDFLCCQRSPNSLKAAPEMNDDNDETIGISLTSAIKKKILKKSATENKIRDATNCLTDDDDDDDVIGAAAAAAAVDGDDDDVVGEMSSSSAAKPFDSCNDMAQTTQKTQNTQLTQNVIANMSDDSETERMLLTAVDETHIANSHVENNELQKDKASNSSGASKEFVEKRGELRQRTLLEMLDKAYGENSPASKRQCKGKTNQKH